MMGRFSLKVDQATIFKEKGLYVACGILVFFMMMGVLITRHVQRKLDDEYIVGVEIGTIYEELGQELHRIKLLRGFHDVASAIRALENRQVEAIIVDRLIGLNQIRKEQLKHLRPIGRLRFSEMKAVAVRKKDNSLRRMLNRGLNQLMENGKYETISKYYFGRNILNDLQPKRLIENEFDAPDDSWETVKRKDWLVIAFGVNNPPFSYYDQHHELTGFNVEIARELCRQLQIHHFLPIPVSEEKMMAGLSAGVYDGVWGEIPVNEVTKVGLSFTRPYCISGAQLFVRENSRITGFKTLGWSKMPGPPPMGSLFPREYMDDFNE